MYILLHKCLLMSFSFLPQNIRIMAKYYTRITMKRMAGLLDLSIDVSNSSTNETFHSKGLAVCRFLLGKNELYKYFSHQRNILKEYLLFPCVKFH